LRIEERELEAGGLNELGAYTPGLHEAAALQAWDTPRMDMPEVHYARSGGVAIAYQVVGEGPHTLVYVPPVANLYSLWELPRAASFLRRLSEEARVVVLNPRGTGLSDRPSNMTLESRVDDTNAVLDAVEQRRATIFGGDVSASVCAFANRLSRPPSIDSSRVLKDELQSY